MKKGVLFFLLLVFWILLVWPFSHGIVDCQSIVVGAIVGFFASLVFGELFTESPHKFLEIKRYLWAILYLVVFLWACLLANLDVAYRVLHPSLPIKPGIVKVRTRLKNKTAIAALANSITLTPGTMTVEVGDDGYLYIHWIYVREFDIEKATNIVVRRFENLLERIFE
ncbi:MAG: Na+/H+ antiporter subunit E [Candidatus Omnitrophica bacterium]|nr:Na+/H+ antiporter subunit E [Candidatus Omnitrophota bacterium]MCM8788261.1 Na+/H+ antiporter subunit E [Candidatus Omnitrophota bacterium]